MPATALPVSWVAGTTTWQRRPVALLIIGPQRPQHRPGRHDRREQAGREPSRSRVGWSHWPVAALSICVVEALVNSVRWTPERNAFTRSGMSSRRTARLGDPAPDVRVQLEQGVEGQDLNARSREQLRARHLCERLLHRVHRCVAVADGVLDQATLGVHEPVVHAPRVHAHALDRTAERSRPLGRLRQAGHDLVEDTGRVPTQVPIYLPRRVGKPPYLLEQELALPDTGQEHPAAARAKVHGDVQPAVVHRTASM